MVQLSILFITARASSFSFWKVVFFVWCGVMIFPRNFAGLVETLTVWLSPNLKQRLGTLHC